MILTVLDCTAGAAAGPEPAAVPAPQPGPGQEAGGRHLDGELHPLPAGGNTGQGVEDCQGLPPHVLSSQNGTGEEIYQKIFEEKQKKSPEVSEVFFL